MSRRQIENTGFKSAAAVAALLLPVVSIFVVAKYSSGVESAKIDSVKYETIGSQAPSPFQQLLGLNLKDGDSSSANAASNDDAIGAENTTLAESETLLGQPTSSNLGRVLGDSSSSIATGTNIGATQSGGGADQDVQDGHTESTIDESVNSSVLASTTDDASADINGSEIDTQDGQLTDSITDVDDDSEAVERADTQTSDNTATVSVGNEDAIDDCRLDFSTWQQRYQIAEQKWSAIISAENVLNEANKSEISKLLTSGQKAEYTVAINKESKRHSKAVKDIEKDMNKDLGSINKDKPKPCS